VTTTEDIDRERMIELWLGWLRSTSDFEKGYYQGRFEEYAAQNALDPDDFPALRRAAQDRLRASIAEVLS
jgi:hypothetical protein